MIPYLIAGAIGFVVAKIFDEDEAPKYDDGGSVLLAPNGKPSNLTPEQYKLVRSQAFISWFGDWENDPANASKVVDENGEPLVVYHGTDNKFSIFEITKIGSQTDMGYYGKGFYFTPIKNYAKSFTRKGIILEFFIKLLNPSFLDLGSIEQKKDYLTGNNDGLILNMVFSDLTELREVVAKFPEQIKLADGTNTTFDANNPDIRFDEGGLIAPNGKPSNLNPEQYKLVRTKSFKAWFGDWENDRENSGKVSGITKEPVVFYHSTKSNFLSKKGENIFKNPPFFFSFKKDVSDYIVRIQHQNKKGRVYTKPFFLKYHNTFDLRHVKILKDKELTRLIKKHTFYQTESDIRLFELKLSLSKFSGNTWFLTENEDFQDYIKNKGYDSFVVYEDGDKNIAVFNPTQIKLADGTNTTFDGNNPDIRYAGGGSITELEKYIKDIEVVDDEDGIMYYGTFGNDGSLTWIVTGEFITVITIDSGNKKGGEGTMAIANLFLSNPKVKTITYQDHSHFQDGTSFWVRIGGDDIYLDRSNFFNYFENKYGFNPDIRFDLGGKIELLAPNGKPSKLTPEQYKLVRSQAFISWFGDWENDPENASKIVDENGEPLVVYHFSNEKFNIFELKGLSDGFFFTKNIEDEEFSQKGWLKSLGLTYEQAIEKGYDLKYEKENAYFLNIKQIFTKLNVKKSSWSTPYFENVVIEFAKRNKKNDGVEFLREIDNKQIIVAFEPNQIKLADGSNTTFDGNNPDIRFDGGGEVLSKEEKELFKYLIENWKQPYFRNQMDSKQISLYEKLVKKGIIVKGGYNNLIKQYYSDNAIENINLAYKLVGELNINQTQGGLAIIRAYNYRNR